MPEAFVMALINEYPRGATIGWHRDAPQYGITAGVSLLSSCRMKLRPYVSPKDLAGPVRRSPRKATHEIELRLGVISRRRNRRELIRKDRKWTDKKSSSSISTFHSGPW